MSLSPSSSTSSERSSKVSNSRKLTSSPASSTSSRIFEYEPVIEIWGDFDDDEEEEEKKDIKPFIKKEEEGDDAPEIVGSTGAEEREEEKPVKEEIKEEVKEEDDDRIEHYHSFFDGELSDLTESDDDGEEEEEETSDYEIKASTSQKRSMKSGSKAKGNASRKQKQQKRTRPRLHEMVAAPSSEGEIDGQISPHLMNFLNDLRDPSKNSRSHHWSDRNKLVWDFCYERFLIFIDFAWVALRSHDQTLPTLIRYADESRRPPRSRWNETVWKGHYLKTNTNANNNLGQALYRTDLPYGFYRGDLKSQDYAGYHLTIESGDMTVFKGGFNSVSNRAGFDRIRRAIRDNTEIGQRLKALVNSEEFVRNFGRRPENRALISGDLDPEGEVIENGSNNFWGGRNPYKSREREHYKVKGIRELDGVQIDRTRPDLEWFMLRNFWVGKSFTDAEVLAPNFLEQISRAASQMTPLVQILNDIIHPPVV